MVNPINVNTQGVGNAYGYATKAKSESKDNKETETSAASTSQSSVSADAVLNYMAQSAVSVTPAATSIDTSKYVDSESAARIAGFMSDFEDKVATGLAAFDQEFQGVNISDSAKMAAVLSGIDSQA